MPLDKQIVGVNFARGLDTQTDKRITIPGRMVQLDNCSMSQQDTLRRRNGFGALAATTAASGVALHDDQLLVRDGTTLKSYASGALYSRGTISNITLQRQSIVHTTGAQDLYDCATSGTYTCYI